MKGWSGRRFFTALPAAVDVRPNEWPRFEPHFVLGVLEYPMFAPVGCRRGHAGWYALFWKIPIFVLLLFCLSCYWWSLNVVMAMDCRLLIVEGVGCNVDLLMPPALRYCIFSSSSPGYVEQPWRCNDFGAEAWSFWWWLQMVWVSGAQIPFFAQKFGKFIYLNQENSTETCLSDFARLSDSQPSIDRGIGA